MSERSFLNMIAPFIGARVQESIHATEPAEDWSRVRSPSRAIRRMKQGHRQNVRYYRKPSAYQIGGVIYAHPEIIRTLRASRKGERP